MRSVPLEEQEVTINLYPPQTDECADVFSSIPTWTRRMHKLAEKHPDDVTITPVSDGIVARVPRKWIRVSPPRQVNMTEEKRQEIVRRMTEVRRKQLEEKANGNDSV